MTAPRHGGQEATGLARLFDAVRGLTSGALPEQWNLAGRQRFLADLGRERRRSRITGRSWGGAGALAAGAAAVHLAHPRDVAPSADAEAAEAAGNGYVSGGSRLSPIRFAGGSSVEFSSGSRGRVGDLRARRGRVVLEGGRASVHTEVRAPEPFLVEAGPYALQSGGAAFDVSWSGSVLEVRVASGAVMVEGPVAREGVTLHKDQAFVAREADAENRCF